MINFLLRGRLLFGGTAGTTGELRVEAWDKDAIADDLLGSARPDSDGFFRISFDETFFQELFLDRRPDVFFKVYDGDVLLLDTSDSVICNLEEGEHDVVLRIPAAQDPVVPGEPPVPPPELPPAPAPDPTLPPIRGTVVWSSAWKEGVLIEAFADADLANLIGRGKAGADGRFEIRPSAKAERVWFRWWQGHEQGRSPLLQPFAPASPIRLHLYDRRPAPTKGKGSYAGSVRSVSGRAVAGSVVHLLEVTLRRCQTLGSAVTGRNGSFLIRYDLDALFADRPDLLVVVHGDPGVPLAESASSTVILPGRVAQTSPLHSRVTDAFRGEGLLGAAQAQIGAEDVGYLVQRSGLPASTIVAYAAASALESQLQIPRAVLFAVLNSDGTADLKTTIEQAVERDDVSPALLRRLPEIQASLLTLARKGAATKDRGRGSLDELLALRVGDSKARQEVVALMFDAPTSAELRARLRERGLSSPGLELLLDVQRVTGTDVALARSVLRAFGNQEAGGSQIATLSPQQWRRLVEEAAQSHAGGTTPAPDGDQVRKRARTLSRRAARLYPRAALRTQVDRFADKLDWAGRLHRYLEAHPDFDLSAPPPNPGDDPDPQQQGAAVAIAAYRRVLDVTQDHWSVGPLLAGNLTSAVAIAGMGPEQFVATFSPAFDGDSDAAAAAHGRAARKSAAINHASSFLPLGARPSLCACRQCKSVFGPAAYLFELLLFLRRYRSDRGHGNLPLLEHFAQRRPEVLGVRLSCANTNVEVPQIDLLNEVLEDLILAPTGNWVGRGLPAGECLPSSRETQGTSEERRGCPQNEPSPAAALALLSEATSSWSLPYDYASDRARSARAALISQPADVALEVWRYAVASDGGRVDAATTALARGILDLSAGQARLITTPSSVERAWGRRVAADAARPRGVRLADLSAAAELDHPTVEAILDAQFVRGAAAARLRLVPQDPCASAAAPRLVGRDVLTGVLDRFHRFERLRRHLGWSVGDLDQVLVWLAGPLDPERLDQVGTIQFLALKLGLTPVRLLALFRDPDSSSPETLRPRTVSSPFEALFGTQSSTLESPDAALGEVERARFVEAQIGKASGESLAMVDRAFAEGFVPPWESVSTMLAAPDLPAAFRRAVCAVHRLAQWTTRLRLDEAQLVGLLAMGGLRPMPRRGSVPDPGGQLRDALRLVDLADARRGWPVDVSELRYLVGDDPGATREHGPTATAVGQTLHALRQEMQAARQAQKPLPSDAPGALRALLSRLLVGPAPREAMATEAMVAELARRLEWSAFFPDLATRASEVLAEGLPEWPGLGGVPVPDPTTRAAELAAALEGIGPARRDWLVQGTTALADEPTLWSQPTFTALVASLRTATTRALEEPGVDDGSSLAGDLSAFLAEARVTMTAAEEAATARRLLASAIELVSAAVKAQLVARAAGVVAVLESTARRGTARKVLVEWVSRGRAGDQRTAEVLLGSLADPRRPAQPITRAFVDEAGATPALDRSVVIARYLEVRDNIGHPSRLPAAQVEQAQPREETSLAFEWGDGAPLPGMQGKRFAAVLEVAIPTAHLFAGGAPITLVVETDGQALVQIEVDGALRTLVDFDAGGQVERATAAVAEYRDLDPSREVTLHLRYLAPPAGRSRTLKLLRLGRDGRHDELQWALLAAAVLRLDRAALGVRGAAVAPGTWTVLRDGGVPARAIDLDELAAGAPLSSWLRAFAVRRLAKRVRSRDSLLPWLALLGGGEVDRRDSTHALNVDEGELAGALQLLGVSPSSAGAITLPPTTTLEQMVTGLDLVDRARRLNLPASALARWNDASVAEAYRWSLAALRSTRDTSEWWRVLAEVYDPVRQNLRDAHLALLVARGRERAGDAAVWTSREELSDYLLTDVQMSPCMTTSRIQFSYAAIQRYVEAALSGRAPGPEAGTPEERCAREWVRLGNYRLAEAATRIKVNPENWIEPEIRPTKTPAWEKLEQTLQSAPLTLHSAEGAIREYAAALAEVARLETIALVTHDQSDLDRPLAFRDTELTGTHVFARARAHPQRLYYRRRLPRPDGRWTPWERVDADMEGTHYLAVVAFGRLRLICADFALARERRAGQSGGSNRVDRSRAPAGSAALTDYEVSLSWIDREHGKWSPVRRSDRFPFTITPKNPPSTNDLFLWLPNGQFPSIKAPSSVKRIRVQLWLGPSPDPKQTSHLGSKIGVFLIASGREYEMGDVLAEDNTFISTIERRLDPSIDIDPQTVEAVRLEWRPSAYEKWPITLGDDCRVDRIEVVFGFEGVTVPKTVSTGRQRAEPGSGSWGNQESLPVTLLSGEWPDEQKLRGFQGPLDERLSLEAISPGDPADFEIEYEFLPQSMDLSKVLRIEATVANADSFVLQVHSVASTAHVRARARFKLRDSVFEEVPEAVGRWTDEWVTSDEFPYSYQTEPAVLATLRVFGDDTVLSTAESAAPAGDHPGTRAEGQRLVAGRSVVESSGYVFFWAGWPHQIFCGGSAVASTKHDYQLVVRRDQWVTGDSSPKILEEGPLSGSSPARTFFIERFDGAALGPRAATFALVSHAPSPLPPITGELTVTALPQLLEPYLEHWGPTPWISDLEVEFPDLEIYWPSWIWSFATFWHPQAVGFRRLLEGRGLARLLRIENQELSAGTDLTLERQGVDYFAGYHPTELVDRRWPRDVVDFTIDGPFSEYNWELFFDSLVYLTKLFDADGKFDEADEIFGLLFDKSRAGNPGVWEEPGFHRIAPLRRSLAQGRLGLRGLVVDGRLAPEVLAQIERLDLNPYQPHLIARGWPSVYARFLRLRFAEHCIRAGEHSFRRAYQGDNRTELELASSRFDLAARVLGKPEGSFSPAGGEDNSCFAALVRGGMDGPPSDAEALEAYLPGTVLAGHLPADGGTGSARAHFCVPANEKLDELRALVADRLAKLRSCQDIEGVRQALSLYGQRIDPALLVRATAEGLDLDVVLGRISSAKPTMYFSALWSRAVQACERARSLEDAWFSARDRADSEAMAQLQNEHEIRTLEMGVELSAQRVQDARLLKEALDRAIESAELRHTYYSTREKVNAIERAEGKALLDAGAADARAASDARTAADWAWVPTTEIYADAGFQAPPPSGFIRVGASLRYRLGGETAVQAYRASSDGHRNDAAEKRAEAGLLGQGAAFERRFDDFKLNTSLALKDIQKGELDRAGAELRIEIAELEHALQEQRVEDAKSLRSFMRDRLTNEQLLSWRANRLDGLRYQQHRLAHDLTVQAKAALVRELGLEDQDLVPDTWDSSHRGLGAAAGLLAELEKMQHTHVTARRAERKKVKDYSLALRQPLAFLELLQRGEAIFSITEDVYDEDAPGDFFRTFSHVSLDVAAVRGPHTNVNVELTQLRGEIRHVPHGSADAAGYARTDVEDRRFRSDLTNGERIATNSGVQDDGTAGRLEDPETPPPFTRNGAIATFRIELRPEQNHFDRQTITDVVLHLTIHSRHGGEAAGRAAAAARRIKLAEQPQPVMIPLHSMFSNAWHRFTDLLSREGGSELVLTVDESHLPMHLLPANRIVQASLYFAQPDELELTVDGGDGVGEMSRPRELSPVEGGPWVPPPIRRLKLRQPPRLGQERRIPFLQAEAAPRRGWLVVWVEGATA